MNSSNKKYSIFLVVVSTLIIGVASGLCGAFLALLLRFIQHTSYGYAPWQLLSNESFLQGVCSSSPLRRIAVLCLCGVIAGIGWWLLYRYGRPLYSIKERLQKSIHFPVLETIIHALLQIITVALGSPLGRETAPRELAAVFADWYTSKTKLTAEETKIMIACSAGAGLAAVYNVPLGGALFVLEALLFTFRWPVLLPAFASSGIAVLISRLIIGDQPQYNLANYEVNTALIAWSIFIGPIIGAAAYWFMRMTRKAQQQAKCNWQLPVLCFFNFLIIGILAGYFPAILGNGKSPAQLEFGNQIGIGISLVLLILRVAIIWSSLRAGARGGMLTPALANGALLGVVLGGIWNLFLPDGHSLNAYAVVGAAAFLAAAQKMPLTAIILIFEFTDFKFSFLIPILFAITGALSLWSFCETRFTKS
ncbi:chloride channel protein [Legionella septentrionalis]|uniref:chloride channel protein n=1 Tax=Legionella septentrionalis TaxID=2498109 RepID=UPI001F2C6416|nr:chloride channel protein [Legionella septentrionalis]